jgi:uncharacterized protein (TIGR03437 family)
MFFCCAIAFAQNSGRVTLPGHMHAGAIAANDLGRTDSTLTLQHVSIFLKPTAQQQSDLNSLLEQQQDPASANYHKWLTPEQYGDRFGATTANVASIVSWLKSQNMTAIDVARSRNSISFTGNVGQIENAFATQIHNYNVNGEKHFANSTDPSVPASIAGFVLAIHGLNDFRMKPHARPRGTLPTSAAKPDYTSGASGSIYVAPADLNTIYDVNPLLNSGISGTSQTIAIVGQTDIVLADIAAYRSFFNLPAGVPQVVLVPNSRDPGISNDDLFEADLDIELSGAMAPKATIIFVNSNDVETSAQYAIQNNLAPVVSMSYGDCEADSGNADLMSLQSLAMQANTQGMTWLAAAGDNGAADCYMAGSAIRGNANDALAVDAPGSVPQVTSVGGTEFNEGSGAYWAAANNANHASALSYIPEMVWNDSASDGSPAAGGGGASAFFAKSTWQTGTGVPADGMRDVPDISLPASDAHDPILIYSSSASSGNTPLSVGTLQLVGGTSCAAPTLAGMLALLNQYLIANGFEKTAGLGNINQRLYALATTPGVFHDITVGNNIVNGCTGVRNCTGGSVGYDAAPGFDQASGLGSVDLYNLATAWAQTSTAAKTGATLTLISSGVTFLSTSSVALTATVVPAANGTPTGTVTFYSGGVSLGSATLSGKTASLTVSASVLPVGLVSISANYSGDTVFEAAAASLSLTITSNTTMAIQGIVNAASGNQAFSPGTIISIYGSLLAGSTQSATTVPLPTSLGGVSVSIAGIAAPIYFVSPGQVNVQIPYTVSADPGVETVSVTYNGQTLSAETPLDIASPGLFVNYTTGTPVGVSTAARGQTIAIYITGAGPVSPTVVSGSTPSGTTTPTPTNAVAVTVGGVAASTNYAYIGVPVWAIGLVQINFTIPATAPLGSQPVLVTIDGTTTQPANILITN